MTERPAATAERRGRARRGEGARLRDDILGAAEQLLLASGDTGSLSIRAIAGAVGITPPSIYLHFDDRNELIFAVCDRRWRELEDRLDEAAARGADPLDRVIRRGRAYVEFGLSHPEHYRVLLMSRETEVPEHYADQALLTQRLAFEPLVADLQAAMDAGDLAPTDPMELCLVLFSAVHGLTSLLVTKPAFGWPPVEQMLDRLIGTLLDGIRPRR